MDRRNFFMKAFAAGGTVVAAHSVATSVAKAQKWGGAPETTDHTVINDGHTGQWPHWPFEEIRIPYDQRFGKVKWPNNEKVCFYMYVTGEWSGHPQFPGTKAVYKRNLRLESETGQYEFNVGIHRALRLLAKHNIKVSFAPHTGMVERFPEIWREAVRNGHDITARTYTGEPTTEMSPADEKKEIQLVTKIIEKVTGKRPVGFNNPGGVCTDQTPHFLAEEGYLYMSGLKGDDLPYGIKARNGKVIVVVGSRHTTTNDNALFGERADRGPREALQFMKDTFNAYYKLAHEEWPQAMNYGIHPQKGCMPERIGFNDEFLGYIRQFKDVWFARYDELAEYWLKNYINV
ncbi:MAG: hypothetical protein EXQ56_14165 [Acidobacteria bacterium]|nr:hypothetical protein [Acidobacteriota bacterium]